PSASPRALRPPCLPSHRALCAPSAPPRAPALSLPSAAAAAGLAEDPRACCAALRKGCETASCRRSCAVPDGGEEPVGAVGVRQRTPEWRGTAEFAVRLFK